MSKTTQTTTVNVLTYAAIDAMTVNELKAECKANGIHGYSRLNKLALQGLLYDVADEQVKAQCIENIEWAEQMQQKLAEVCDCGTTVTITHERQHIDGIGAFVYIESDGTYVYQDMCGYRTYKTLKGLNKYVQSAAKAANRKAPEIIEATETEVVADTIAVEFADGHVRVTSESLEALDTDGRHGFEFSYNTAVSAMAANNIIRVTWRHGSDVVKETTADTTEAKTSKVAADQVREARASVDPTTAGRITTFDTIAEAIEGVDNLIAWEYADCPDDYDLRAIAEAITCERCGKLAVLPTYDELSDQFDASALWKVVESHYTGDDDPEPTDPTDPATDADEATDEAEGFDATGIPTESEVFAARFALDFAAAGYWMINLDRARAIVEADRMRHMPDISELPELPDVPATTEAIGCEAKHVRLVVTSDRMVDCGESGWLGPVVTLDADDEDVDGEGAPTDTFDETGDEATDRLRRVGSVVVDGLRYPVLHDATGYRVDLGGAVGFTDGLAFSGDAEALDAIGRDIAQGDGFEARTWLAESIALAIDAERSGGCDMDASAWNTFEDAMGRHRLTIWERAAYGTADTPDDDPDQTLTDQKREILRANHVLVNARPYGCAEVRDEIEAEIDMIRAWEGVIYDLDLDGCDLTTENVIRRLGGHAVQ